MLPQALDGITPDMAITDVAEALRLPRHVDGPFENGKISGQRLVLLGAGDLFVWQRQTTPTSWTWLAGATLALTASADGHDAQAFHLGSSQKNTTVDALSGIHAKHWDIGLWSR